MHLFKQHAAQDIEVVSWLIPVTVHKATKPNQNESFFIGHDREASHSDGPA
jgi:hypothetical protein